MREKSVLRVIVSALLAGLCTFSGVRMIQDIFPEPFYMDINAVYLTGIVIAVLALAYEAGDLQGRVKWILPAVLLILFFGYGMSSRKMLAPGILRICRQYLSYVNDYYGTAFFLEIQGGDVEQIPEVFGFLVLAAAAFLYLAAVLFQKYFVLLIFPAFVLSAELMVGYCPNWLSVALFAVSAVLACSRSWRVKKQELSFAYLAMALLLVFGVSSFFFGGAAEQISSRQNEMLGLQHDFERWIMSSVHMRSWKNPGAVDNHEPQYENKEVLEFWVDKNFGEPVYLRGFYGTDYRYSQWGKDEDGYKEACRDQGIDTDQAVKSIANMSYDSLREIIIETMPYAYGSPHEISIVNCKITDKGTFSKYWYLPYFTNMESFSDYRLSGDHEVMRQRKGSDVISFQAAQLDYNAQLLRMHFDFLENSTLDWYDEFVQSEYLKTAEDVPSAKPAADQIMSMLAFVSYMPESENNERLLFAALTAQFLEQTCTYSQKLDELPENADPVEYFLSTSHRGYCVHFASAGTLILRSLGVPARYVSGYVAKPENSFINGGGYVFPVMDSNAHAWTEIYLDGFGWMPVEMTPGTMTAAEWDEEMEKPPVSEPVLPEESQTESENLQTESSEVSEETESESASGENSENMSDAPDETESVSEPETTSSESETGAGGGIGTGSGNTGGGQNHKDLLHKLFAVLLAWTFLALLLFGFYRFRLNLWNRKNQLIREDIKRGRYRRSIFRMNRQMYRQLRRTGALHIRRPSDQDYLECLIHAYPDTEHEDWERFIQIAEKTAFSGEELVFEEAAHCRRLFDAHADKFSMGKVYFLWLAAFAVPAVLIAAAVFR